MTDEEGWSRRLLERAQRALAETGTPFVALVVLDGVLVSEAFNEVAERGDPTAHAELLAIQRGCAPRGRAGLAGATLYTSAEPCLMCLGAAQSAKLARVRYASSCETLAALHPGFRHAGAAWLSAPPLPLEALPSAAFDPLFAAWSRATPSRRAPNA
ncbi:MAG: nucleoside deaminase [Alphaproteobacteria bacterium]|nr:nucleoside deaminase [Alphaproteobacteria bacterium]MCB9792406.1 nucleoside deaminase [Alphaproteobacteria bacterium]